MEVQDMMYIIDDVIVNSIWLYNNEDAYEVIAITNILTPLKNKYPMTIVCEDINSKLLFSMPACDWYKYMTKVWRDQ